MILKIASLYGLSLISLLLASAVLLKNSRQSTNISFFGMVFFSAIWGAGIALFLNVSSDLYSIYIARIYYVAALATTAFIAIFGVSFPHKKPFAKLISYVALLILIVGGIDIIATQNLAIGINYQNWGKEVTLNPTSYLLYGLVLILFIFIGLSALLNTYLKSKKNRDKQQAFILFSGLLISVLVGVYFNYYLPLMGNYRDIWVGPLAVSAFLSVASYSILKLKLFNIRFFVARSIAYSLSIGAIIGVYSIVVFGLANTFFGEGLNIWQIIFFAVFSSITALFFQPIKKFFDNISNSLFYRDAYDGQSFLNEVNSSLVNKTDLKVLLEKTSQVIKDNLKVDFCNFYIDSQALIDFHIVGTNNSVFANPNWSKIYNYANTKSDRIFTIDQAEEANVKIRDFMHEMGIEIIMQLKSGDQVVGQMIIGQKLSGNAFTNQDTQVLQIIADEVAIAVQNTLRFEEIAHFNITMQQEINIKTAELKKSNQKLRELDEAKDEFISMASHQLRTPLTSVKGYISMMLEGDTGKLTSKQSEFLNQAFASSQRMVYLIADLLNISRLKTGKFVIEAKPTYLPDVVEEEMGQLYETAKSRGLELTFDKPNTFPTLDLDETKIRQVIMNYVDNAIYYTPSGGHIKVNLIAKKDKIEFKVIDDGLGVPKADQPNLFTKFFRASNAKKARPDGTGLGLYMAQKVITAQGGSIIFSSKQGEGSTFGFSFPIKS